MVFTFTWCLGDYVVDFPHKNPCVISIAFIYYISLSKENVKELKIINFGLKSFNHLFTPLSVT